MEKLNCHECGLESADDCEQGRHIPAIDALEPCSSCVRNPRMKDLWDERWCLDENGQPMIEE